MKTVIADTVVDASVLAAFCFDEPEITSIAQDLESAVLFVPAIIDFEFDNTCWNPVHANLILRQFAIRRDIPITIHAVDHDGVVALALQTGLTAYDASYLWLSRHLGVELLTFDKQVWAAAQRLA